MARKKSQAEIFLCGNCGDSFPKWFGRCPSCNEWNSLTAYRPPRALPGAAQRSSRRGGPERGLGVPARPRSGHPMGSGWLQGEGDGSFSAGVKRLADIPADGPARILSGIGEFDRVLGGGIVPGSVVLVGGDPGIGKSTLLLQVAAELTEAGRSVLYVSGEESAAQTKIRAQRLGVTGALSILAEPDLERILEAVEEGVTRAGDAARADAATTGVEVLVIDSIQSTFLGDLPSAPGSVLQVREGALALTRAAKTRRMAVLLIGHMTKEGSLAGPRTLEHIVDAVLTMEGDRFQAHRILRSVKNRFGSVHEIGVFDMRDDGLQEVANPSRLFLGEEAGQGSGSVVVAGIEGTRSLLMEVQALVHATRYGIPQRTTTGFDARRLAILLAVLTKRGGVDVTASDVFVNVTGGLRVDEPGVDLGVLLAIASSYSDRPVGSELAAFGEIGLGGEVRRAGSPERRIAEAVRLGFRKLLVPAVTERDLTRRGWKRPADCRLHAVGTLHEALSVALNETRAAKVAQERTGVS